MRLPSSSWQPGGHRWNNVDLRGTLQGARASRPQVADPQMLLFSLPQRACLRPDFRNARADAAMRPNQQGEREEESAITPHTHLAFSTSSRGTHIDSSFFGKPATFVFLVPDAKDEDRFASPGGSAPPPSRTTHWTR